MTNPLRYAGAAVLVLAAACSDGAEQTTAPDFARNPPSTGLACSFSDVKKDADIYFAASSQLLEDANDLIASMRSQFGSTGNATTTALGFDILSVVAAQHNLIAATDPTVRPAGTPEDASRLANGVLACMTTITRPTLPIDFALKYTEGTLTKYRGALSTLGAFEVRGGATDANDLEPIVSANKKASIAPPAGGFHTWLLTTNPRLLFYASPISNSFIQADDRVGTVGYRWLTVPDVHVFAANVFAIAGLCVGATDRDRLQEVTGTGSTATTLVLALPSVSLTSIGLDCVTGGGAVLGSAQLGAFGRILHFARQAVLPAPAYAAASGGGTGGLLGGLSDIGVSDVGLATLSMTRIASTRKNTPIPVTITMTTAGGLPMKGETVDIRVSGNSGSFTPIDDSGETDEAGEVSFTFTLDKPGGYTVSASSDYGNDAADGTAVPVTVFSNLFHIKQ